MFEPVRGGTRGGQAEFKWSDVSADKDRENYLGHSVNAPTGRWQKNKDVHWYNRDVAQNAAERAEEIRKVKEAEADALAVALGFAPAPKTAPQGNTSEASPSGSAKVVKPLKDEGADAAQQALENEEKRRRKAQRKEDKRARKEQRRAERARRTNSEDGNHHCERGSESRSRSPPRRRSTERESTRSRRRISVSRSPPPREKRPRLADYDRSDREWERERDRRRWDLNSRREEPRAQWGR